MTDRELTHEIIGAAIEVHRRVTLKDGIRRRVLNYKPNEETHRGDAVDAEEKPRCQTAESES